MTDEEATAINEVAWGERSRLDAASIKAAQQICHRVNQAWYGAVFTHDRWRTHCIGTHALPLQCEMDHVRVNLNGDGQWTLWCGWHMSRGVTLTTEGAQLALSPVLHEKARSLVKWDAPVLEAAAGLLCLGLACSDAFPWWLRILFVALFPLMITGMAGSFAAGRQTYRCPGLAMQHLIRHELTHDTVPLRR